MTIVEIAVLVFYSVALLLLAAFGLHKYVLLYLFTKYKNLPKYQPGRLKRLPRVTVQLPIFNEKYVVKRLLESVCALDYPKNMLEIQVLDDSIDETCGLAKDLVAKYKSEGFDIHYIHRKERTGFKAGALDYGFRRAKGKFIAIFDADFAPKSDFLKKTLPYLTNSKVGLVQARWEHINRNYSLLTRIQSIFLDGHFVIEHTARNRSGRFFNFNGTAGIWRKAAIIDAGGWQYDTITEDLDLSYRAQMSGWEFVYLPDLVVPAELPVEMNAYKSQQHRWAKGSVQTAKKLLPKILKSKLPGLIKLEAAVHLVSNFTYLFMTIPSMLMPVILQIQVRKGWEWMIYIYLIMFFSTSLSVIVYYLIAQRESHVNWKEQILFLPMLMSLGIGLSINNAKAVLEGVLNHKTEFKRTPKYKIEKARDNWKSKAYRSDPSFQPICEIMLGLYFMVFLILLLQEGLYVSIPFFILFQFGFWYVGITSLLQAKEIKVQLPQFKFLMLGRKLVKPQSEEASGLLSLISPFYKGRLRGVFK